MTQTSIQFAVGAEIYGSVVTMDSAEYTEFQRFQEERFAQLRSTRADLEADPTPNYTEATHTAPSATIPIVMRRRAGPGAPASRADEMIAIARMELPGATLIEAMIDLRPGSTAAEALATGRVAEIGSFAALEGISRFEVIGALNALAGVLIELARRRQLDWLWIFPRAGFMSMARAEIPGVLPPFHFTLSPDVLGWRQDSAQLAAFRAMRMRGFLDIPLMYEIKVETFADDLAQRVASYDQLAMLGERIGPLLTRAMISTQRTLRQEVELLYPQQLRAARGNRAGDAAPARADDEVAFLPVGLSNDLPLANYLRQVLSKGGVSAQAYKELSYSLLDIHPGQRILDVGCGAGMDLPALAQLTGPAGAVVGLENNPALVNEARALAARRGDSATAPMFVFHGDAQQMTIPDGEFDRARTDRALQHFPQPQRALAEIWRVLKPGGVLTLIEPDWGAMVVAPGSPSDEGDASLAKALDWCRRHLAHPLIGRNMYALLAQMPPQSWQSLKVVVAPFTFTEWSSMDAVLLLSRAAAALQMEEPAQASEIAEWLRAVEAASVNGSFFGYIPLFYAVAVKSAAGMAPGV